MSFLGSSLKTIDYARDGTVCLLAYANKNRFQDFFSDVTIKTDNNQNISANRMVLSCYSAFFEKMFKSKLKEQYESSIVVKGVEGESLKLLINYIYTGQLLINSDNVASILSGADYLQLNKVKEFCFEFMENELTCDNYCFILKLADVYNNTSLKQKVYKFFCNNLDEILENQSFKNLFKNDLLSCISMLKQPVIKQSVLCKLIMDWVKHDTETRKHYLPDFLKLIVFKEISIDYLQILICDKLIQENLNCSTLMNFHLLQLLKCKNVLDNESRILSIGGTGTETSVTEVYSCSKKSLATYPDLPTPLKSHCLVKLNSYIYCMGGYYKNDSFNDVRRLNLKTMSENWEEVAPMNRKRRWFGAAMFEDRIIVGGGWSISKKHLSSTEAYSNTTNEWKMIASLKQKRTGTKFVVCDGSLFALGGYDGKNYLSSVERLDGIDKEWRKSAPMNKARTRFTAVSYGGFIYAIGGKTNDDKDSDSSVEQYNPQTNTWTYLSNMNEARREHCACVFREKIFVIGGCNELGQVNEIECYDSFLDKWFVVSEIDKEMCKHFLVAV